MKLGFVVQRSVSGGVLCWRLPGLLGVRRLAVSTAPDLFPVGVSGAMLIRSYLLDSGLAVF